MRTGKIILFSLFILSLNMTLLSSCFENKTEKKATPPPDNTTVQNGPYTEYYPNGTKKMEGNMKNGKRDGVWKAYYKNGSVWSIGFYINGLRDGIGVVFYENGQKYMEGEYKNDKQFGKWSFYSDKGEVIKDTTFN